MPAAGNETHREDGLDDARFGVLFVFYQREPIYSLGLAAISAYLKAAIPDVRTHLLPIFPGDSPETIAESRPSSRRR